MRRPLFLLASLVCTLPLSAQQQVRVYSSGNGNYAVSTGASGDRAMIGISTSSGSKRDTLGVLVSAITTGGPAEKAGLTEGDRIQSINGVSLKVSRDDASDDEMGGIMQRRLTRELGKVKAGDEVTLQVWHDGTSKAYKLKTVSADDLSPRAQAEKKAEERAWIGIAFGLTGNKRDTAGVFVSGVSEDGPAEKAGIVEGDRIAAVNGVSLKLSKDDIEDGWVGNSRLSRLSREVSKAKPGDVLDLTVVSGGRARSVKVTTAKASSAKKGAEAGFTFFRTPGEPLAPMPPLSGMHAVPTPPTPPTAPRVRIRSFGGDDAEVQVQLDQLRSELGHSMQLELPKIRAEIDRAMRAELPRVHEEVKRSLEESKRGLEQAQKELQAAKVNMRVTRTIKM